MTRAGKGIPLSGKKLLFRQAPCAFLSFFFREKRIERVFYGRKILKLRYTRPRHDENVGIFKKTLIFMKYRADPALVPVPVHAFFKSFFRYVGGEEPRLAFVCGQKDRKKLIACFSAVLEQKPYVLAFGGIVNMETPLFN
jgi:hypothetical protein